MSLMNRLGNSENSYQLFDKYPRVLTVCSAGLLRSPSIAFVLSNKPFNFNTRAAGLTKEYALIPVDEVLVKWADYIVCTEQWMADVIKKDYSVDPETLVVLNLPDMYSYRQKELLDLIKEKCCGSMVLMEAAMVAVEKREPCK